MGPTLVTFNAGLQRVRFFGRTVYEPTPHLEERFDALAEALKRTAADLIALQEVYQPAHRDSLIARLSDTHPYAGYAARRRRHGLGSGLLLLSRLPLKAVRFHRFKSAPLEERLYVETGFLESRLEADGIGALRIVAFHMTAGGASPNPAGRRAVARRASQVRQLLREADAGAEPTILLGDLNSGPGGPLQAYTQISAGGYVDAVRLAHGAEPFVTWDPEQPLIRAGTQPRLTGQRIDHVLLSKSALAACRVVEARRVLDEPCVAVPDRMRVPLSDHYGVLVRLGRAAPRRQARSASGSPVLSGS